MFPNGRQNIDRNQQLIKAIQNRRKIVIKRFEPGFHHWEGSRMKRSKNLEEIRVMYTEFLYKEIAYSQYSEILENRKNSPQVDTNLESAKR